MRRLRSSGGRGRRRAPPCTPPCSPFSFSPIAPSPARGVSSRAALTAALAAGALWEVARWGFGAYLARFAPYGHLYGPFGVVVASLVWIYVSAAIFIWGGELTALLTERAHGAEPVPTSGPDDPR